MIPREKWRISIFSAGPNILEERIFMFETFMDSVGYFEGCRIAIIALKITAPKGYGTSYLLDQGIQM